MDKHPSDCALCPLYADIPGSAHVYVDPATQVRRVAAGNAFNARLDTLTDAMSGEYQRTTANPPIPNRRADVTVSLDDI